MENMENMENMKSMDFQEPQEPIKRESNWPTILGSNIVYLIVLICMIAVPLLFSSPQSDPLDANRFYITTFMLELIIVGLPPLIYLLMKKGNINEIIRLNRIGIKELMLVILMAFFGYGIIIFINYIWLWVISFIGQPIAPPSPPVSSNGQYIIAVICVSVVPAVVEEFLFRGLIMRGYENLGKTAAIIITGVLFSLLHMSLVTMPAIILLGILISYVVQRTDSIWAGITYHFVNNTIAVTLAYLASSMQNFYSNADIAVQDPSAIPPEAFIIALVIVGIVGLFCLVMFTVCLIAFHNITRDKAVVAETALKGPGYKGIVEMIPAIIALVIMMLFLAMEVVAMVKMA